MNEDGSLTDEMEARVAVALQAFATDPGYAVAIAEQAAFEEKRREAGRKGAAASYARSMQRRAEASNLESQTPSVSG